MKKRTSTADGTVTLTFSANMLYVRPVRHFISALCQIASYPEEETEAIALVTTEILNNSIEHGARGPEDLVHVTLRVSPDSFHCEVLDPGRGGDKFAGEALRKAAVMPDLEEPRGRGLFLINNYMDQLEVSYDPKRGTRVVVDKKREA